MGPVDRVMAGLDPAISSNEITGTSPVMTISHD
jgi:hypothetical protein